MARIIVVEDDIEQQEELVSFLNHAGHMARGAATADELENCLSQFIPEIVLLDYNLPDATGVALAENLREKFDNTVGIVMVTARSSSTDRIECRRAGADDYLVKPIDFSELLALIGNLQTRLPDTHQHQLSCVPWKLMVAQSELIPPDSSIILLSAWEVSLLETIAKAQNQIASRDDLVRALGKNPDYYDPRALETTISRLRRKLPSLDYNRYPLEAVRNVGYKFVRPLKVIR